jgi:hypothetical protein
MYSVCCTFLHTILLDPLDDHPTTDPPTMAPPRGPCVATPIFPNHPDDSSAVDGVDDAQTPCSVRGGILIPPRSFLFFFLFSSLTSFTIRANTV